MRLPYPELHGLGDAQRNFEAIEAAIVGSGTTVLTWFGGATSFSASQTISVPGLQRTLHAVATGGSILNPGDVFYDYCVLQVVPALGRVSISGMSPASVASTYASAAAAADSVTYAPTYPQDKATCLVNFTLF